MGLRDVILAATQVVPKVIDDLGSTVTIRHDTVTRAADNSPRRVWADAAIGVKCVLTAIAGGRRMYSWGQESAVELEGLIADTVPIEDGDGVVVTAGEFAGQRFVVEQQKPAPLGHMNVLGLAATELTFT